MLLTYKKIADRRGSFDIFNYLCGFFFLQIDTGRKMEKVVVKGKEFKLLLSESKIKESIKSIADKINTDLEGKNPLFLAVLNGSFMFAADLMKNITIPCEICFVKLASYEGMESGGKVKEVFGLSERIDGRTVVIIEDIVDSGRTMQQLLASLSPEIRQKFASRRSFLNLQLC